MATASYPTVIKRSDQIVSNCRTQKKSFPTSAAAEAFASEVQLRNPGQARQHAYACEECPNWHLSAMTPEAHAMIESRSNLSEASKFGAVPGLGYKYSHLQTRIKEIYQQLLASHGGHQYWGVCGEVANKVDMDSSRIATFLAAECGYVPTERGPQKRTLQPMVRVSLDSITAEEQQLESRLRELAAKKAAILEAKALKFSRDEQGRVVIKKEFQTLILAVKDAQELAERLVDFLAC